jgi:hypothetical protein
VRAERRSAQTPCSSHRFQKPLRIGVRHREAAIVQALHELIADGPSRRHPESSLQCAALEAGEAHQGHGVKNGHGLSETFSPGGKGCAKK